MSNSDNGNNVKKFLRSAKAHLVNNELEECIEVADQVLDLDLNNYLAYIFKGKAFHGLNEQSKAIKAYQRATEIDDKNLLAWKGLFLIYKNSNNYTEFYHFIGDQYLDVLTATSNDESIQELAKEIVIYNKKFNNHNKDENFYEVFLKSILPSTKLGREIGELIQPYDTTITELINITNKKESKALKDISMKFPLNNSLQDQLKLNSLNYVVYSKSMLPKLYKLLIDYTSDDEKRYLYEDLLLRYNYEVLKCNPIEEEKYQQLQELLDTVKGMIVIKHPSEFAWTLYFDLICSNFSNISEMNLEEICWFIKKFDANKLGLIKVLHGFLYSEISPFPREKVEELLSTNTINSEKAKVVVESSNQDEEVDGAEIGILKEEDDAVNKASIKLSADQVLSLMVIGFEKAQDSLLASRIIISYYIHLKEYSTALNKATFAVKELANLTRFTSISLPNYKNFLFCSLAIIYTYYEAPKNFSKALELYERVLKEIPSSTSAKIGKGLILIERGDLQNAKSLLEQVIAEKDDIEAKLELGWCQVKLNEFEEGRSLLNEVLSKIEISDSVTSEKRSLIMWRLAESYIQELKSNDNVSQITELVEKAYKYLIASIKHSKTYAPSFTSLGLIYKDYHHDENRSIKCFYKAFELDSSQILAAKNLVSYYADRQDWSICEILCQRVLSNDNSRRLLKSQDSEDLNWPHRILGISYLQQQKDSSSIEFFQNSIRLKKDDVASWSGLGEAYYGSGRFDSALKVFEHSINILRNTKTEEELLKNHWYLFYMLSLVQAQIGDFQSSIENLYKLLSYNGSDIPIITALFEILTEQAQDYILDGFIGRAINCCTTAIEVMYNNIQNPELIKSQRLWKSLTQIINIYLNTQTKLNQINLSQISSIINQVDSTILIGEYFGDNILKEESQEEGNLVHVLTGFLLKCSVNALVTMSENSSRSLRASLFYNLGLAYLYSFQHDRTVPLKIHYSIKCFKKAIQLEAINSEFWVGLAISTYFSGNPKISQHCFIKAISLSPKDSLIWSNLATLFLKNHDLELSKEAFQRVETISPESSNGWLGSALVDEISGNLENSWKFYTHGFTLSNGRSSIGQLLYGNAIIQKHIGIHGNMENLEQVQELSIANFALNNYLIKFPEDKFALNIFLIVLERLEDREKGIKLASQLCDILESKYEKTEDDYTLVGFARAKATLARFHLSNKDYAAALENSEFALDILEGSADESNEEVMKIILSARVVIGLCHFFTDGFEQSLEQFRLILTYQELNGSEEDKSVLEKLIILISQVLYTYDKEDTKTAAVDQLFTYIENHGSSLLVALTMGAISLVENLDDVLPAVLDDLKNLNLEYLISDTHRSVPFQINEINKRLRKNPESNKPWQRSALMFPNDYKTWENLDDRLTLEVTSKTSKTSTEVLSKSLIKCGTLRQIQRGLFLNQTNLVGYKALKAFF
ncbi:hypothetical protein PACTADRAFT_5326 [Pachysolen tannophilus NRRL Y-2460]|uniref:Superkiller protein 3 n=1 Tax=Pachysolen tannophilus NRRL Y-2460 TaxID=669874 RepID=A0A1E4TPE5_PACTA|nr:hypothetical protein PACTADRAFT_5326 [Pachysolen tannophilus NRRL Y-2460]